MHDDGFGGGMPQQRMQTGGYPPPAAASHVPMAGPRNQGLSHFRCFSCMILTDFRFSAKQ